MTSAPNTPGTGRACVVPGQGLVLRMSVSYRARLRELELVLVPLVSLLFVQMLGTLVWTFRIELNAELNSDLLGKPRMRRVWGVLKESYQESPASVLLHQPCGMPAAHRAGGLKEEALAKKLLQLSDFFLYSHQLRQGGTSPQITLSAGRSSPFLPNRGAEGFELPG